MPRSDNFKVSSCNFDFLSPPRFRSYQYPLTCEGKLASLVGMWEKGKAIREYRGVDSPTWYQLSKQTGRDDQSLKRWYELYEAYPDKDK